MAVLGLVLFNAFVSDLDEGVVSTLGKYASESKLGAVAGTLEGCAAIQQDVGRLESWANRKLMRFSKSKCGVFQLGRNNCKYQWRLGCDVKKHHCFLQQDSITEEGKRCRV